MPTKATAASNDATAIDPAPETAALADSTTPGAEPQPPVESAPSEAVTAAPVPPAAPAPPADFVPPPVQIPVAVAAVTEQLGDPDVPFAIRDWCGYPNYCCLFCDNAVLDDELGAWEHYMAWHQFRSQTGTVTRERRALSVAEFQGIKDALGKEATH